MSDGLEREVEHLLLLKAYHEAAADFATGSPAQMHIDADGNVSNVEGGLKAFDEMNRAAEALAAFNKGPDGGPQ